MGVFVKTPARKSRKGWPEEKDGARHADDRRGPGIVEGEEEDGKMTASTGRGYGDEGTEANHTGPMGSSSKLVLPNVGEN